MIVAGLGTGDFVILLNAPAQGVVGVFDDGGIIVVGDLDQPILVIVGVLIAAVIGGQVAGLVKQD